MNDLSRSARLARAQTVDIGAKLAPRPGPTEDIAAELGLPVTKAPIVLVDTAYPETIAAGIARTGDAPGGLSFVLAPNPTNLAALRRHGLANRTDLAVMRPHRFNRLVRERHARALADQSANGLADRRPDLSARSGMTKHQAQLLFASLLLLGACGLAWPPATLATLGLAVGPLFLALVWLRCSAVIEAWRPAEDMRLRLRDEELPVYTVLVALYREAKVAPELVAGLKALDYPPDRLDIKFIVERDDPDTRAALIAQDLPWWMEVIVAPDGQPRTKPRALNIGLMEARGTLLTIYDAEDCPDPRQLRLAANLFHNAETSLACLQARLVIDNADDSLLTRMFALEYAALFDVINVGLLRAGLPVLLGGTSNHFRVAALRQVGGWDAWNVTEDADLAFRLARAGYRCRDIPSVTYEEAPAKLGFWFRQRKRWLKGFLQTAITHTRAPRRLFAEAGPRNASVLLALCCGTLASALGFPLFLAATVVTLASGGFPAAENWLSAFFAGLWVMLTIGGALAIFLPALAGARNRGLLDLVQWLPLKVVYLLLISAAAWSALVEYVRAPHRWNKTDHAGGRTSRRRKAAVKAG